MNDETIAYQGTISRKLFFKAQKLHARKRLQLLLVFYIVVAVVMALAFGISHADIFKIGAVVVPAVGLMCTPLLLGLQRFQLGRVYDKTPFFREPLRGSLSQAGIEMESATGRSDIPWSGFTKYVENEGLILVYRGPAVFYLLAAEFFATPSDWERARELARQIVR